MKHAINELKLILETAKNNEPIQRAEGSIEDADLNLEKIKEFQELIPWMEVFINPPYEKPRLNLQDDIEHAINCRSAENGSDTPDFILAEYLMGCLRAWDLGVAQRERWYGRGNEAHAKEHPYIDLHEKTVSLKGTTLDKQLSGDMPVPSIDDDLGELDPTKACKVEDGGCESCQ